MLTIKTEPLYTLYSKYVLIDHLFDEENNIENLNPILKN